MKIGFISLLQIVFIVLKLMEVITWSWLWVLSPILISTGIGLVAGLIVLLLFIIHIFN